jgi:hypothetical protein
MRYYNLRVDEKTHYLRLANRPQRKDAASKYRGVSRRRSKQHPWMAQLSFKGIRHYLGAFKTEIEAAKAYNECAFRIIGPHAVVNEIAEEE